MCRHMAVMDVACGRLQLRCGQAFSELAHGGFLVQEVCNLKQTHLLGAWCFSVSSFLMAGMDVYLYVCRLISLPFEEQMCFFVLILPCLDRGVPTLRNASAIEAGIRDTAGDLVRQKTLSSIRGRGKQ